MNPSNYARWRLAGYLLFCVLILIFPLILNNDYLLNKYMRYLAENTSPDWDLVRKRMEEITEIVQYNSTEYTLLGNAYLRLGEPEKAIAAYQKSADNLAPDDPYLELLRKQIGTIQSADSLETIAVLRPAILE